MNKIIPPLILTLLIILPVVQSDQQHQKNQNSNFDDIEIEIYAGVYDKTNGNIGLGWIVSIVNNLNESIDGYINASWNELTGKTIRFDNSTFYLSAHHPKIDYQYIDFLHFPHLIVYITATVQTNNLTYTKSGIEIGPIVLFYD